MDRYVRNNRQEYFLEWEDTYFVRWIEEWGLKGEAKEILMVDEMRVAW